MTSAEKLTLHDAQSPPLFTGRKVVAEYVTPVVEHFRGNPLIEALPEDISDAQFAGLITRHITVTKEERKLPPQFRDHYIEHITRFYHPLAKAYHIHRIIQRMIRGGYIGPGRNPADIKLDFDIHQIATSISTNSLDLSDVVNKSQNAHSPVYSGASAAGLVGVSGMGKSTTVKEILYQLFPQVIFHQSYNGRALPLQQVVWLYMQCPHNASLKSFLEQFFWLLDMIFPGANYYRNVTRNGRITADNLIIPMAQLSLHHCLGLIVMDETQNINQAASGGAQRMLNLFTKIVNLVGVPVLLIGTPEAVGPFTAKFRMARRLSSQGDPTWNRMRRHDLDWELFVEALWRHQYLWKPTTLTPELRLALYNASAGITDVAIKVFAFAQRRAIAEAVRPSQERITPELILDIPDLELELEEPVLKALRKGKEEDIDRIDDISMPSSTTSRVIEDVGEALAEERKESLVQESAKGQSRLVNLLVETIKQGPIELSAYERLNRAGFVKPLKEIMSS